MLTSLFQKIVSVIKKKYNATASATLNDLIHLCLLVKHDLPIELRSLISLFVFYVTNFTNETILKAVDIYCDNSDQGRLVYGNIHHWNTSEVTTMHYLFFDRTFFNDDISLWDVSNVTDMSEMFGFATSFNQPLERWNVSNVKDMYRMFWWASTFNQPLETWDVHNVTDMCQMFEGATSFHQSVSKWDTSSVIIMNGMFDGFNF